MSEPLTTHGRWSGYAGLLGARMKELFREPEVIFWIFMFPILLAFGLGIAFRNKPVEKANVVFAQQEGSDALQTLLKSAPDAQRFNIQVQPPEQAANSFRLGKVDLEILPDGKGGAEYVYDPARPESVLARNVVDDALQIAAGRKPVLSSSSRVNSEPGSRYIDFLIPGLLGMNLMGSGMWGIGFALVDMRQRKLLKRFIATPMRRSDFLLALASSRLILMIIELFLVLGFGILMFHMRVMGSWPAIILVSVLGAMTFAGLGLLTASRAQKIETASGIMNLIMMPMWIFSGIFFSYERFPAKVLPIIRLLPLTALNDSLRAVILEGKTLASLSEPLIVLCLWGGLSFLVAVRLFRWT
ncbi:ABC multidrug efflux pump, inner membrane subunit [Candidatus Koribacter versatilis Ellin345]|uniref:ABC multidrug efflux pump, inner membrane subunit n=2 Tax=Candidatus Korobacter versatilis TaxID=658062 RepID=Q1IV10_KORVE|nr:ABC multidrug efflux pump, inner membrane subunit [Candidatus Koribacter versatilis Ellin345]